MTQVSIYKAISTLFVAFIFSIAATVSAQGQDGAMTPAPSMDNGVAFSLPIFGVVVPFSLTISLLAFLKH
ncbi:hypothetical protein CRYUN_Cryun16bG0080800 [Craigia yunnanensis]